MGSNAAFLIPGIPDDAALMCFAMLPRGCYGVLKCVSRRWKAALGDEHVYSLREQLGHKESWVYVNVFHHPPPSTTTINSSSSASSSFRGGQPPSRIRVDSLYAFSPILHQWFCLSETTSSRSSRRIKMVAVKHKQYIFGDDFIIRDAITGACTPGPQLPSDTYLSVQLAASDSHVVLVSATPQVVFGDPDSPGDVIVHVLAVDEAGMPQGEWQRLLPRRWTGLVSLLAHEGGLWHLIGRWAQGTQGRGGGGGGRGRGRGRRGSERLRYRWDRQMASFDPRTLQWIQEDEEEEEEGEGDDDPLFGQGMMHGDMDAAAPFGGGDNNESDSTHAVEIDYGEGPGGCHKQLLLQAASACEVLRHRQQTLGPDLLALQGEDLQWEMRGLLTRGPQPLVADGQGREQGGRGGEKGKAKEGVLINEENVVRVMASGGTGLFSIIGDQMMIVPVAANGEYLTGPGDCVSEKLATDATSAQSVSSRKGGMLCLLRRGRDMVVWENGLSRVLEAPILWGDQIPGGAFVMSI